MSLRVECPGTAVVYAAAGDDRDWFDYTHEVADGELVVYLHSFRRVRERLDRTHDQLLWKHSTTKIARRFAVGTWLRVTDVEPRRPPAGTERVARRPLVLRERRRVRR